MFSVGCVNCLDADFTLLYTFSTGQPDEDWCRSNLTSWLLCRSMDLCLNFDNGRPCRLFGLYRSIHLVPGENRKYHCFLRAFWRFSLFAFGWLISLKRLDQVVRCMNQWCSSQPFFFYANYGIKICFSLLRYGSLSSWHNPVLLGLPDRKAPISRLPVSIHFFKTD